MSNQSHPSASNELARIRKYATHLECDGAERYVLCADIRLLLGRLDDQSQRIKELEEALRIADEALEEIENKDYRSLFSGAGDATIVT